MSRLFIGNLPHDAKEKEILEKFNKFGEIRRLDLKLGFAFIFYETPDGVPEAIAAMNGQEFLGSLIVVEAARSVRDHSAPPPATGKPCEYRVSVHELDAKTSWQDLKDWARAAGPVTFTNVFYRDGVKHGVVEYENVDDVEKALTTLADIPLHGATVKLEKESFDPDSVRRHGGGGGYGGGGRGRDSRMYPGGDDGYDYDSRGSHYDSRHDRRMGYPEDYYGRYGSSEARYPGSGYREDYRGRAESPPRDNRDSGDFRGRRERSRERDLGPPPARGYYDARDRDYYPRGGEYMGGYRDRYDYDSRNIRDYDRDPRSYSRDPRDYDRWERYGR